MGGPRGEPGLARTQPGTQGGAVVPLAAQRQSLLRGARGGAGFQGAGGAEAEGTDAAERGRVRESLRVRVNEWG